jgi:hypothetical protein
MEGTPADGWEDELEGWLEPFLGRLRRQAQRRWAPFYCESAGGLRADRRGNSLDHNETGGSLFDAAHTKTKTMSLADMLARALEFGQELRAHPVSTGRRASRLTESRPRSSISRAGRAHLGNIG